MLCVVSRGYKKKVFAIRPIKFRWRSVSLPPSFHLVGVIPLDERADLSVMTNGMITATYGGIRDVLNRSPNY